MCSLHRADSTPPYTAIFISATPFEGCDLKKVSQAFRISKGSGYTNSINIKRLKVFFAVSWMGYHSIVKLLSTLLLSIYTPWRRALWLQIAMHYDCKLQCIVIANCNANARHDRLDRRATERSPDSNDGKDSQTLTFGTNTMHSVEVVVKRIQVAATIKDAWNWSSWTNVATGVPTTHAITTL